LSGGASPSPFHTHTDRISSVMDKYGQARSAPHVFKAHDRAKGQRRPRRRMPEASVNAGRGRIARQPVDGVDKEVPADLAVAMDVVDEHVIDWPEDDAASRSDSSSTEVALTDLIVGVIKRRKGVASDFEVLPVTGRVVALDESAPVSEPQEPWEHVDAPVNARPVLSYAAVVESRS